MDLLNKKAKATNDRPAPSNDGFVGKLVESLLDVAIDGRGPVGNVKQAASKLRQGSKNAEAAVDKAARESLIGAAIGGFVTNIGGFASMPVAIPVNIAEFYLQATRTVGKIADLRGYDTTQPEVRSAVMLAMSGARVDDVLSKVGLSGGGNFLNGALQDRLPESAMMMVNKAVSMRVVRTMGERSLSFLGKGIPLVGGVLGAGLDTYMMYRIVENAKDEFPKR